jgi:hypothetical protein
MQGNFNHIVIVACLIMTGLLAWLEYRRAAKHRLPWRITAVVVAVASLACLALPVRYKTNETVSADKSVALLTAGFNADSLKSKHAQFVTIDPDIKRRYPQASLIYDLADRDTTARLHIYGDGLKDEELQELNGAAVEFHPSLTQSGVTSVSWNKDLTAGEELHVQGIFNNTSSQKVQVLLSGLSTKLGIAVINPKTRSAFDVATIPKATGQLVYKLQTVIGSDTTDIGSIPVQVGSVKPLKVLMLTAAPGFESRFLKNWLAVNGYAVVVRSAISKGKFGKEFINTDQMNINTLTASTLGKFDVVMGDLSVFASLSTVEASALRQQVADAGLGVIVQADSAGKGSWLQRDFPVSHLSGKEPSPSALVVNGKKSNATNIAGGRDYLSYRENTQPIVKTPQGRILAGSSIAGAGKIVFTTLNNTFSWALAGNKQDYSLLWSALISKVARKGPSEQTLIETTALPVVDHVVTFSLAGANRPSINIAGASVAVVHDPAIPFQWQAQYRPDKQGWQSVSINNKITWLYTYGRQEWHVIQAAEKTAATTKYAAQHSLSANVTKQIQQKVDIAVPKIYFYILLLAACIFLWIETKLS